MHSDSHHREPRFGVRFTIRSLLILTTVVAAFFGGRRSMKPELEAERLLTKIAQQEADAHARRLDLIQQESRSQFIRQIVQPRPSEDWRGFERAERQNMRELQQRIEKAIKPPEL
jgi:hypothetical protein